MATWTHLQKIGLDDPLKALSQRCPSYYSRYAGADDEFGYRLETFARWMPLFDFLYEDYFKVELRGIDNIPAEGRALLVGNHSGLLPIDGAMITIAMCHEHESPRRVRYLATDWFYQVPGLAEWVAETGQVRATKENATKLLDRGELVGIYPEGLRGVGKPYAERYRMMDFHPGFVQLAISTQTKLIPVATVGGDEIFPNIVNLKTVARIVQMPFFPVTWAFPWLPFPYMFLPLPVRWMISIKEPIDLGYPPEKATDKKLVLRLAREIQHDIQSDLNRLLRERKSTFTGWDPEET